MVDSDWKITIDRLQVGMSMKNYLNTICNELESYYEVFIKQFIGNNDDNNIREITSEFCENTVAILDYFIEPIMIRGKNVIQRKLNSPRISNFSEEEENVIQCLKTDYLDNFQDNLSRALLSVLNENNAKEVYEDLREIILSESISLFKKAQLYECINSNIELVNVKTDEINSCILCQTMSKFKYKTRDLLNVINDHSFCKFIIEPIYSNDDNKKVVINDITLNNVNDNLLADIKPLITNLSISVPELISKKTFIFSDDISSEDIFVDFLKDKYSDDEISSILEKVEDKIISYQDDDFVFISKQYINEHKYLIIKSLIQDKIVKYDLSWWKDSYYEKLKNKYVGDGVSIFKDPFINYTAEQDYLSYFIESAIYYILTPKLLKNIDYLNYEQLKHIVFNNIEFTRE